ncbi:FAD-dependent monooxygenase [Streptomyces albireticuli]|uniref:3-(3-hydroxyphenyl)propionate hydroxylase n=1 Tax=Streptomyces albireticuli TaxID=1940 RepID=A0A2A2D6V2_9ACTN|nr:FAD-dependent monooxygenase [Streptomyces albireticuli]MCD9144142.1 FAD-dependent monooxygenase [Streptomyces albireticuli]MCD9162215.1 FAD-dependent monooxygenase [Streptomyces albireticuli]MCD9193779.1 FAD-dependent monooxygenase [Streptomyces albireticuli]PAU47241.1 3-(3-hydroxyphenyl)propionate hydroxylase [Streptomyces albireticuli]
MTTSVLIVGAGPTGLTLGCVLARAGVPVRIIDKSPEFHRTSRGKGLNQRSRELLEDLGVAEEAAESGIEHIALRKYRDGAAVADHVAFGDRVPTPDAPYASGLIIPQWRTEEILRGRLASYGVEVELGREMTGFTQDERGVTVTLADGGRVEAGYLVGCDGGHSPVRKALGVGFEGATEAEECMVIGDVEVDGLDPEFWHQWFDEDGAVMLCPFRGSRHWQLQGAVERDAAGHLVEPSLAAFQRLFDRHVRMPGLRPTNPTWLSSYRINVRMADRFRVGRVFLAGDAAHVHSIAGGLGMNTGIQDAFNLGWKLALVARGVAGPGLLATYEEERLPVAAWTLKLTDERLRAVREGVMTAGVGTEAVVTDDITTLGVGYGWSSLAWGGGTSGERAPDAPCVEAGTGRPVRLFEVFAGPHFTLLGFGADSAAALAEVSRACGDLVRTCLVDGRGGAADIAGARGVAAWSAGGAGHVELVDAGGHARRAYGGEAGVGGFAPGLVLIRPDNHIAMSAAADRGAEVVDRLRRLGR